MKESHLTLNHAGAHRGLSGLANRLSKFIKRLIESIACLFHHRAPPKPAPDESKPLPPGGIGPELQFDPAEVQSLFTEAATDGNPGSQVWVKDNSELLVHADKVRVELDDGLVVVTIPVFCDQTGETQVQVAFAVGGTEQPAGMVAATEERPRGPAQIVDLWGESLTAFAWRALLAVTTKTASRSGFDLDRAGLIPAALTASRGGLRIATIARHAFDRVSK